MNYEEIQQRASTINNFFDDYRRLMDVPGDVANAEKAQSTQEITDRLEFLATVTERIFRAPVDNRRFYPVEELSRDPQVYRRDVRIPELGKLSLYYGRTLSVTDPEFSLEVLLLPRDERAQEELFSAGETFPLQSLVEVRGGEMPTRQALLRGYGRRIIDASETMGAIAAQLFPES